MKDTIIKGTGNSRSLRSVPNLASLAPTYDKLLELLTGSGLPIDLGPLNPAGAQQVGTDLSKANLLKDATAALYGLPATAVPDAVFASIYTKIQALNTGKGNVFGETGSYLGVGGGTKTLNFSRAPVLLIIAADLTRAEKPSGSYYGAFGILYKNNTSVRFTRSPDGISSFSPIFKAASVSWAVSNPDQQFDAVGAKYDYIALCL